MPQPLNNQQKNQERKLKGMNEVINDIQTENTGVDETTVEVSMPEEPVAKPAAKRKPRATKKTGLDYELLTPTRTITAAKGRIWASGWAWAWASRRKGCRW